MLLILVALGVLGMHTVGREGPCLGASSSAAARAVPVSAESSMGWLATGFRSSSANAAICACDNKCPDASDRCVAVQKPSGLSFLLFPRLLTTMNYAGVDRLIGHITPGALRWPPAWRIGLVLADQSVLRR